MAEGLREAVSQERGWVCACQCRGLCGAGAVGLPHATPAGSPAWGVPWWALPSESVARVCEQRAQRGGTRLLGPEMDTVVEMNGFRGQVGAAGRDGAVLPGSRHVQRGRLCRGHWPVVAALCGGAALPQRSSLLGRVVRGRVGTCSAERAPPRIRPQLPAVA